MAAIFCRVPEIMLCKPMTNDRWDRRAVELAAYLLKNGHCNVPEVRAWLAVCLCVGLGRWCVFVGVFRLGQVCFEGMVRACLCVCVWV